MTPDPIGLFGGINLYVYAGLNPINTTDPKGLWVLPFLIHVGSKAAPYVIPLTPYIPQGLSIYEKLFSPTGPGVPEVIEGGKSLRENYEKWKEEKESSSCPVSENDTGDFKPEEIAEIYRRAEYIKAEEIYKQLQREIAQGK